MGLFSSKRENTIENATANAAQQVAVFEKLSQSSYDEPENYYKSMCPRKVNQDIFVARCMETYDAIPRLKGLDIHGTLTATWNFPDDFGPFEYGGRYTLAVRTKYNDRAKIYTTLQGTGNTTEWENAAHFLQYFSDIVM